MISFRDELQRVKYELNVARLRGNINFIGMVESSKSEKDNIIVQVKCEDESTAKNVIDFINSIEDLSYNQIEIEEDSDYYKPTLIYNNSDDLEVFSN